MLSLVAFDPVSDEVVGAAETDDAGGDDTGAPEAGGSDDEAKPLLAGAELPEDNPPTGGYEAVGAVPLDETGGGTEVMPGRLLL